MPSSLGGERNEAGGESSGQRLTHAGGVGAVSVGMGAQRDAREDEEVEGRSEDRTDEVDFLTNLLDKDGVVYGPGLGRKKSMEKPVGLEANQLRPDSILHSIRGDYKLKDGEFFDPIVFLNHVDFCEELRQRGSSGGTSIKKRGILEYNSEGNTVTNKRFWVRNIIEDGTPEEYMKRIQREKRRQKFVAKYGVSGLKEFENIGESLYNCDVESLQPGEGAMFQPSEDSASHMNIQNILGSEGGMLHSLLKSSVTGSMRDVIKDELQAWLGLKNNAEQREKKEGDHGEQRPQKQVQNDTEEGEVEEDNTTPDRGVDGAEKEKMITPVQELMDEEREAQNKKERRVSSRQAFKRQSTDYEMDTLARAAKRKECMEETGTDEPFFSLFDIIPVHLILHIASICGLNASLEEDQLFDLINAARDSRLERDTVQVQL